MSSEENITFEKELIKSIIDAVWEASDGNHKQSEDSFYHMEELNSEVQDMMSYCLDKSWVIEQIKEEINSIKKKIPKDKIDAVFFDRDIRILKKLLERLRK